MLQELIKKIEAKKTPLTYEQFDKGIDTAIQLLKAALPEFEECLKKAVTYGNRQEFYDGTETLGQDYYNQNYKK